MTWIHSQCMESFWLSWIHSISWNKRNRNKCDIKNAHSEITKLNSSLKLVVGAKFFWESPVAFENVRIRQFDPTRPPGYFALMCRKLRLSISEEELVSHHSARRQTFWFTWKILNFRRSDLFSIWRKWDIASEWKYSRRRCKQEYPAMPYLAVGTYSLQPGKMLCTFSITLACVI